MNTELSRLASELRLSEPAREALRLAFGLSCAERIRHLLEDERATRGLFALRQHAAGLIDRGALAEAAREMAVVANSHRGSNSIDGAAYAAVSATYAVANALQGRALEAASYAAYASVYAYAGYAVTDPAAFASEFAWQLAELKRLSAPTVPHGDSTYVAKKT